MTKSEHQDANFKPIPDTRDAIALAVKCPQGKIPRVVSGGKGRIAEQILEIAFKQGIRVREDSDLAELLSAVNVNSEIPCEAFAAVAEILTYIFSINNAMAARESNENSDLDAEGRETDSMNKLAEQLMKNWRDEGNSV